MWPRAVSWYPGVVREHFIAVAPWGPCVWKVTTGRRRTSSREVLIVDQERRRCPNCGRENRGADKTCWACGHLLVGDEEALGPAPGPAPEQDPVAQVVTQAPYRAPAPAYSVLGIVESLGRWGEWLAAGYWIAGVLMISGAIAEEILDDSYDSAIPESVTWAMVLSGLGSIAWGTLVRVWHRAGAKALELLAQIAAGVGGESTRQ